MCTVNPNLPILDQAWLLTGLNPTPTGPSLILHWPEPDSSLAQTHPHMPEPGSSTGLSLILHWSKSNPPQALAWFYTGPDPFPACLSLFSPLAQTHPPHMPESDSPLAQTHPPPHAWAWFSTGPDPSPTCLSLILLWPRPIPTHAWAWFSNGPNQPPRAWAWFSTSPNPSQSLTPIGPNPIPNGPGPFQTQFYQLLCLHWLNSSNPYPIALHVLILLRMASIQLLWITH